MTTMSATRRCMSALAALVVVGTAPLVSCEHLERQCSPSIEWRLGRSAQSRPHICRRSLVLRGGATSFKSSKDLKSFEYREAIKWTIITMLAAIAFGVGIIPFKGVDASMDYFTGFIIEKVLSVDNLFVFVMLFDYFRTPEEYQRRVLTIGIMSAVILRGIMIGVGVTLVQRFRPVLLVFAGILVVSSMKVHVGCGPTAWPLLISVRSVHADGEGSSQRGQRRGGPRGQRRRGASRQVRESHDQVRRQQVLHRPQREEVRMHPGAAARASFSPGHPKCRYATPMLMVLLCIELSDIVFAVDSIPAIVGITQDSFIVYTSNIFAILGLRNLYVILAKAVKELIYLKAAVAVILGFVGAKMVLEFVHVHISSAQSLAVVASLLCVGVVASLRHRASLEARRT